MLCVDIPKRGDELVRYFFFIPFLAFLWVSPFPVFGETTWESFPGPTIKVEAVIHPYVNVTINLADEKGLPLAGQEPVVLFDCDKGPGAYWAKNPLLFSVVTNAPLQVFCEATSLKGQGEGMNLPPEHLSIAVCEPGKEPQTFSRFSEGKKLLLFETPVGGVVYTAQFKLQLDITHQDRAGQYEGAIFVEVFYRP